jgi:hypothetical protein
MDFNQSDMVLLAYQNSKSKLALQEAILNVKIVIK